jgi:hypothetical protein
MFSVENWWCGDLQSFINRTNSSFSIQALENAEVLSINRIDWETLESFEVIQETESVKLVKANNNLKIKMDGKHGIGFVRIVNDDKK